MQLQGMVSERPEWFVYCVSCNNGSEKRVAERLRSALNKEVIFPVRVMKKRKAREWSEEEIPLTPGYVFIYSDSEVNLENVKKSGVHRVLSYGDDFRELHGGDFEFAMWVNKYHGRIEVSQALLVGDRVKVVEGPLTDVVANVIRIDKHQQRAFVSFLFAGRELGIWFSYNWLMPIGDSIKKNDQLPIGM